MRTRSLLSDNSSSCLRLTNKSVWGCGQPCDGLYCYPCTCQQRGVGLTNGICLNCTYRDGKPLICCKCEGPLRVGFCWFCASNSEISFNNDPKTNSFDDSQNLSDYSPQPQYKIYPCELCGNDSHYGYDYPPWFLFFYEQEPCYNQNYNENYYPHNLPSFLCCDNCEGPHESFQCQLMNQNFLKPNPGCEPNSSSFDQYQPLQSFVTHQIPQRSNEDIQLEMAKLIKNNRIFLNNNIFPHEEAIQKEQEELAEYINSPSWNHYNNDGKHSIQYKDYLENYFNAIAPVLPTEEPAYSLSMSEYEGTSDDVSECDVPVKNESSLIFTTFSNSFFDCNDDFTSSDDELLFNEDVPMENFKVYSNSLFDDEEINSNKEDPHYFNTESDLIESLSNRDTLFDSSPKFDYLEEFSGELMPTSIVNEERIKREYEEYIILMEKLLAINSFHRSLENFHVNMIIETLPTSTIPVDNDSTPLLENESSNFDHHNDPSFPRPPTEPPNVEVFFDFEPNLGQLISAMMNNIDELNEDECFNPEGDLETLRTMFGLSMWCGFGKNHKKAKTGQERTRDCEEFSKTGPEDNFCTQQQKPITIQGTVLAIVES
nr:hypothetical protein [Tanacetum cinerariifolium]GEX52684.1 hypothetical protein [Tanacetum cinerariifolium]